MRELFPEKLFDSELDGGEFLLPELLHFVCVCCALAQIQSCHSLLGTPAWRVNQGHMFER